MQFFLNSWLNPVAIFLLLLSTSTAALKYTFPKNYDYLQQEKCLLPLISLRVNYLALINILTGIALFSTSLLLQHNAVIIYLMSNTLILSEFWAIVFYQWIFIPTLNNYQYHLCCRLENVNYSLSLFYLITSAVIIPNNLILFATHAVPQLLTVSMILYLIGDQRIATLNSYISASTDNLTTWAANKTHNLRIFPASPKKRRISFNEPLTSNKTPINHY